MVGFDNMNNLNYSINTIQDRILSNTFREAPTEGLAHGLSEDRLSSVDDTCWVSSHADIFKVNYFYAEEKLLNSSVLKEKTISNIRVKLKLT